MCIRDSSGDGHPLGFYWFDPLEFYEFHPGYAGRANPTGSRATATSSWYTATAESRRVGSANTINAALVTLRNILDLIVSPGAPNSARAGWPRPECGTRTHPPGTGRS